MLLLSDKIAELICFGQIVLFVKAIHDKNGNFIPKIQCTSIAAPIIFFLIFGSHA